MAKKRVRERGGVGVGSGCSTGEGFTCTTRGDLQDVLFTSQGELNAGNGEGDNGQSWDFGAIDGELALRNRDGAN